ncbi:MAG: hypothetical protein GX660_16015 [Clostridiaceae bacterium]|jgi:hypothetical protein|nr:hypothetical protein [Clostridiaceae bacterium]HPD00861.1 hypothetical protein [Acetivibrio sp.]
MGNEYIYISIGLLTLVINIILVTAYIKLNYFNKKHRLSNGDNRVEKKPKVQVKPNIADTMDVNDRNLSYGFDASQRSSIDQAHGQNNYADPGKYTVVLPQNPSEGTQVLGNNDKENQ